jgi:glycosyltransferase involved in cell wall biosynthesis
MDKLPLFSICIPVFNGKKYIGETIASIIGQNYPNIEVLVQDNASTDGTWEVLESLGKNYQCLKLERNKKNKGMAPNWNLVINRAKGDFIMLLSADDLLEPNFINRCLEIFNTQKVDIVTTNHFYLEMGNRRKRRLPIKEGLYQNFSNKVLLLNPFSINFTLFTQQAIKRLYQNNKIFSKNIFACDYDLWIRIALSGHTVFYIGDCLASYRIHETNLSRQIMRMNRQAAVVVLAHRKELRNNCKVSFYITLFRFILRTVRNNLFYHSWDKRLFFVLFREAFH